MSTSIRSLCGREILDSRGNPTVEVEIRLENNLTARAAAPSGASAGSQEAVEKRDRDERYGGKGVRHAVININELIAPAFIGRHVEEQGILDEHLIRLDGSENKSRLGGNAILAVSLAVQKAAAMALDIPLYKAIGGEKISLLPAPMMNILNGGMHASNNVDIQEFMIVPHGFDHFAEALRAGVETFHALGNELTDAGHSTAVGDEGGFAPNLDGVEAALAVVLRAIERAGYRAGEQISIALDCAANELYRDGLYHLPGDKFSGDAEALINLFADWCGKFPIVSIEDGCAEKDWDGWRLLTERLGKKTQLVGDDLFVTNPKILRMGIAQKLATALLVKPNQIGTVSETLTAIRMAQAANYETVMSHRSGETEYADIADFCVGAGCRQIKTGAPCRGERTAKYNQLLRIADDMGKSAVYAGREIRYRENTDE